MRKRIFERDCVEFPRSRSPKLKTGNNRRKVILPSSYEKVVRVAKRDYNRRYNSNINILSIA